MIRAKDAGYSGRFSAAALVLACAAALLAGTGSARAGEASQAAEVGTHYSVSVSGLELLDQETGEIELAWSVASRARDDEVPQSVGITASLTGYCIRARASGSEEWTESCGEGSSVTDATVTVGKPYCHPDGVDYTLQGQARVRYQLLPTLVLRFLAGGIDHLSEWSDVYKTSVTWRCVRSVYNELKRDY